MPAATDSGYAFVVLLRDGDDATGLARLLEDVRLPEASTPSVFAAPPVRGVDFFGDDASQSTLDQWWADNIPGDALPAYLLNHEEGLAAWIQGVDGTFYIGLPNAQLADEYPKSANIKTFLSGGPLDFATIIMRDFSGGGDDDGGGRGIIFDQGEALRMAALSSDFPIDLDDTAFDFGEPEPAPPAQAPPGFGAPAAASPFAAQPSPFSAPPAASPFGPPPGSSPFGPPPDPAASPFSGSPTPAFPTGASPLPSGPGGPPGGAPPFGGPTPPLPSGAPMPPPANPFSGGFVAPPFASGTPAGAKPAAPAPETAAGGSHPFDLLSGGGGGTHAPAPSPPPQQRPAPAVPDPFSAAGGASSPFSSAPPPSTPAETPVSPFGGGANGGNGGGDPTPWQATSISSPTPPGRPEGGFTAPKAQNGGRPGGGMQASRPKVPKFSVPGFSVLSKGGRRGGFAETPNRELANMIVDRGPTIVVMGSRKGGVGKTSYAAGIAIVAGTVLDAVGHKAAIVDANIANPDAWGQMNLREGAATVREVVAALTANREPPPPVHSTTPALAVYPESRETTEYSKTDVKRFADYLRRRYTFIVVDMSNRLPDPMAGPEAAAAAYWLEHSDVLVLPTTSSKNDFNGVLDYLDVRGLPPTVVPYIVPQVKKNREHPVTQQYLTVIKERVHRIVEIPDEADKVRYAGMEGVPVEQVSPSLRAAYRELTEVIIRVPPRARI